MSASQNNICESEYFLTSDEIDIYPELYNLSSRWIYRFLPRPVEQKQPEFLYIPDRGKCIKLTLLISKWNFAWEAGQLRKDICLNNERFNTLDDVPMIERNNFSKVVSALKHLKSQNVYLLPDTRNRYEAYISLYSLLPAKTLQKFGLPLLKRPIWPALGMGHAEDVSLPNDFRVRLEHAFASYIWPFINSGSPLSAFSRDEPTILLAHNLDFWLPHITRVIEDRLCSYNFVEFESQQEIEDLNGIQQELDIEECFTIDRCRQGGHIWYGEDEAHEATLELIAKADRHGKLRSIIDAIRSNRVEEDFSNRWSNAREDFERKLYKKRQKTKVKFVELDYTEVEDSYGVVGPDSDISETLLWNDFFSLLDVKEKQIVVCLKKGVTNLTEIATELGYANHSPISKALTRIRHKASKYLES